MKSLSAHVNEQLEHSKPISFILENQIELQKTFLRIDSDAYSQLIVECRRLYDLGQYSPLSENDKFVLESLSTGKEAIWINAGNRRQKVKLDLPANNPDRVQDGKRFIVYVATDETDEESGLPIAGKIKYSSWSDGLDINNDDPKASKSFWARHQCDKKKDTKTAGFWACYTPELFGDMLKLRGGKERW